MARHPRPDEKPPTLLQHFAGRIAFWIALLCIVFALSLSFGGSPENDFVRYLLIIGLLAVGGVIFWHLKPWKPPHIGKWTSWF